MNLIWSQYADFLDQMSIFWAWILLSVGLAVLVKGADWLVDGAVAIAKQLKMSPLIIGLTIVAMGTSAPEVAASIKASLENSPGIAVGNVYGSNIANLALVAGLCAVIRPITVSGAAIRRDIPLMLAAVLLLYGFFCTGLSLSRTESVFLLLVFIGVIAFMIHSERIRAQKDAHIIDQKVSAVEQAAPHQPKSLWLSLLAIFLGLICLAEGANLTVSSASNIGAHFGLSPIVIGATIVAVGTSLPELITCLIAAFRGHDDLSIGNLIGSNIFNTLLVIGASGLVRPYSIEGTPQLIGLYYWLMIFVLVLFSILALTTRKVSKLSGLLLVLCYAIYIAYSLFFFSPENAATAAKIF